MSFFAFFSFFGAGETASGAFAAVFFAADFLADFAASFFFSDIVPLLYSLS